MATVEHRQIKPESQPSVSPAGLELRCPSCFSSRIKNAPRSEYRGAVWIRTPRQCMDCGVLFPAPCGLALCGLTVLIGAACLVPTVIVYLVPGLAGLIRGHVSLGIVSDVLMGVGGGLGAVGLILVGIRTAGYSKEYKRLMQSAPPTKGATP